LDKSLRVLLINASAPSYNLGLEKAANWWRREHEADVMTASEMTPLFGFDFVWISAIFSWDVPRLLAIARIAMAFGNAIEVGGPGTFGVQREIRQELGISPQSKPDLRFEREPGDYKMVFWSRGCPAKNCSLGFPRDGALPVCSVPEMEGWKYTLYTDVRPARVIGDNNLSALPRSHQELIVERTLSKGFDSIDANSGFEPRSFRPWVVELWKRLPLVAWRFAYDELGERDAVLRTIKILDDAGVSRRMLKLYCLAGNEPLEACEQRVCEINEWGCYPMVQRRRPLDYMEGPLPCLHDWTEQKLIDFQRWGTRFAKSVKRFKDYVPNLRDKYPQVEELFPWK
jgi:hypothetical protein